MMKSKIMKWARHIARMGAMTWVQKFNQKTKDETTWETLA